MIEEGALRPSRNPGTRGWNATTALADLVPVAARSAPSPLRPSRNPRPAVCQPSAAGRAAQRPRPPLGRPPVVEEGALRPSRNPVTRGWNATTAHRACRDGRKVGSHRALRRSRQARPAVRQFRTYGSEGFETVAAQPPQPPVWASPVVEEGALRPSRNPVTRGWDATTAHRACRDGREVGSQPRCGGLDRLDQRCASPSVPSEGFETVAAQPPQPPVWASPVVEEGALRPSRNPVTRGWGGATAHRACRDGREVGSQPRCGGLDRLDQLVCQSGGGFRGVRDGRWATSSTTGVGHPGVEEVALRVSKPCDPGLGRHHRRSSLSRPPRGRLRATLRPSRQARPAVWQSQRRFTGFRGGRRATSSTTGLAHTG